MEELQMKIIDCLRDHCTYNSEAQRKPNFFSLILGKIAELRYETLVVCLLVFMAFTQILTHWCSFLDN
jgi:hypothetical protein